MPGHSGYPPNPGSTWPYTLPVPETSSYRVHAFDFVPQYSDSQHDPRHSYAQHGVEYSHSQPRPQYPYSQHAPEHSYSQPGPQYSYSQQAPEHSCSQPGPQHSYPQAALPSVQPLLQEPVAPQMPILTRAYSGAPQPQPADVNEREPKRRRTSNEDSTGFDGGEDELEQQSIEKLWRDHDEMDQQRIEILKQIHAHLQKLQARFKYRGETLDTQEKLHRLETSNLHREIASLMSENAALRSASDPRTDRSEQQLRENLAELRAKPLEGSGAQHVLSRRSEVLSQYEQAQAAYSHSPGWNPVNKESTRPQSQTSKDLVHSSLDHPSSRLSTRRDTHQFERSDAGTPARVPPIDHARTPGSANSSSMLDKSL